jgi:hypothetical protein
VINGNQKKPLTVYPIIHFAQLWNDIKTDDLEEVNKNLLKNLRKMANDSPVVKVKNTFQESKYHILSPLIDSWLF